MRDPIRQARGEASTPIPTDNATGWAPDQSAPQFANDKMAPGSNGDVRKGWLRGFGDGESMPGFDCGPSGFSFDKKRK